MANLSFLLFAFFLPPLLATAHQTSSGAQNCRINKLSASQPTYKQMEFEGGIIEAWDETEDQMQCAGIAAIRISVYPQGFSHPNYHPSPRIAYIIQGQGIVGMSYPGCPETFYPSMQTTLGEKRSSDSHQKIIRVRQGDVVAVLPGVVHWCYNDGSEDLIAITIDDINGAHNQLDPTMQAFYLSGGLPRGKEDRLESNQTSIISPFSRELMAKAMGVTEDLMEKMQRGDKRGYIVKVLDGSMSTIAAEEKRRDDNGLDEPLCDVRLNENIDRGQEADVFSRDAGRLNSVNMHKLPVLQTVDLSAEKGSLHPNAILAPHWLMNAHTIVYVTQGQARLQVADNNGKTVFDDRVREGHLIVVPQFFASMMKAGSIGIEWISFKTSSLPMRSPIVGHMSAFKAMPLQVITESYGIPINQSYELKFNMEHHMMLIPPSSTSY